MGIGLYHVEDRITNKENLSGSENFRHLLIFAFGKSFSGSGTYSTELFNQLLQENHTNSAVIF